MVKENQDSGEEKTHVADESSRDITTTFADSTVRIGTILKRTPAAVWHGFTGVSRFCYISFDALKTSAQIQAENTVAEINYKRNRIPVYEIQHDGTIKRFWGSVENKENRAYDLQHNHKNQIFMRDYANALDVDVNDIENGDVILKPSKEYQTYMKQKVLSDSMMAGSSTMQTVKYLTIANLGLIVIAVMVGVSLAA